MNETNRGIQIRMEGFIIFEKVFQISVEYQGTGARRIDTHIRSNLSAYDGVSM